MESDLGVIFGEFIFLYNVIVEVFEDLVKVLTMSYRGRNLVLNNLILWNVTIISKHE